MVLIIFFLSYLVCAVIVQRMFVMSHTLVAQPVIETIPLPTNDCAVCVFLHINLLRWSLHADNWEQSCGK